jgi:hypothetical protein
MGRACSICQHTKRSEIDRALIGGEPQAEIADRFRLAQSSLSRHLHNHLAPRLANSLGRYEDLDVKRLRAWMTGLIDEAALGMLRSRKENDPANHRAYMGEFRKALELQARLGGIIGDGARVQIEVDARKQLAVIGSLSEQELRALVAAAGDSGGGDALVIDYVNPLGNKDRQPHAVIETGGGEGA